MNRGRWAKRLQATSLALAVSLGTAAAEAPPFAPELERLAEILGSLQFLSELCDDDTANWRDQMGAIAAYADNDETSDEWQARLANRFNVGYLSFAAVYRSCSPSAIAAIERYSAAGANIADTIATRYGAPVPAAAD